MTILAIAAAALAAVSSYRHKVREDPDHADEKIRNIRQSTSVVLAVGEAIWAIIDALQLMFRRTGSGSSQGQAVPISSSPRFGTRVAAQGE